MKISGASVVSLAFKGLSGPEVNRSSFDVLNDKTQAVLEAKAKSLIRPTPEGATALADELRGSTESGASYMCGPLASVQLKGITTFGYIPNDFWLANARLINKDVGTDIFSSAFPSDKFDLVESDKPITGFDFGLINIQPGDFIYFFGANDQGGDHMITVSKRDSGGTLWGITNYPNANGDFVVKDVPIWNNENPEESFIKELAEGRNSINFSSGQGGFKLWRMKPDSTTAYDQIDRSRDGAELQLKIESLAENAKAKWHVLIADIDSGKILAENQSRIPRHSASVIKVPIAMCVMSVVESKAKTEAEIKDYLANTYIDERSLNRLIKAMLVTSEEGATESLCKYLVDQQVDTHVRLSSWGINNTYPSYRRSTEEDIYKTFANLYDKNDNRALKYRSSHKYLLDYLSAFSDGDKTRLGKLSSFGIDVKKIYNKRGSIATKEMEVVADSGIVEVAGESLIFWNKPYFISLNGTPRKNTECSYETLEEELLTFVEAFAKYLNDISPKKILSRF